MGGAVYRILHRVPYPGDGVAVYRILHKVPSCDECENLLALTIDPNNPCNEYFSAEFPKTLSMARLQLEGMNNLPNEHGLIKVKLNCCNIAL